MDKTSYANLARAWEYVEDHAYSRQTQALLDAREQAAQCGLAQGSAAQAQLLHTLACMMRSTSVITIGSGSLVEIVQLVDAPEQRSLQQIDQPGSYKSKQQHGQPPGTSVKCHSENPRAKK